MYARGFPVGARIERPGRRADEHPRIEPEPGLAPPGSGVTASVPSCLEPRVHAGPRHPTRWSRHRVRPSPMRRRSARDAPTALRCDPRSRDRGSRFAQPVPLALPSRQVMHSPIGRPAAQRPEQSRPHIGRPGKGPFHLPSERSLHHRGCRRLLPASPSPWRAGQCAQPLALLSPLHTTS